MFERPSGQAGKAVYLRGFITNLTITEQDLTALIAAGRARCKIENETHQHA